MSKHIWPRFFRVPMLTALGLSAALSPTADAQTQWVAGTSNWFTPANWSLGVPNSLADAVIGNGGTPQITAAGAAARTLRVGRSSGGGNLLVSGAGTLNIATDIYINENGVAPSSLTVQNGATVNTPLTAVGVSNASSAPAASLTLSGAGTVYNSPIFTVGLSRGGATTLTVQSGAGLSTSGANVGTGFLANSTATVTGADSGWINTGTLTVSDSSLDTGVLNISNQGTVWTDGLSIGAAGTVNLSGGELRLLNYSRAAGGKVNHSGGTLRLVYPGGLGRPLTTDPATLDFFGASPTVSPGRTLFVEGPAGVNSGTLTVAGGSLFTGHLNINGGLVDVASGGTAGADLVSIGTIGSALTVRNPGSIFSCSSIFLTSVLNVSDQAVLRIYGSLDSIGTVNLSGGTIHLDSYVDHSPSPTVGTLNYTAGTFQFTGNRTLDTDTSVMRIFGRIPAYGIVVGPNKTLGVDQTATLGPSVPVVVAGGTLRAQTLILYPAAHVSSSSEPSQITAAVVVTAGSTVDATLANLTIGDATLPNGFYSNGNLLIGYGRTVTLADSNDAVLGEASLTTIGSTSTAGTLSAPNGLTLNFGGNITGFGTVSTPHNPAKPFINNGHIAGTDAAHKLTLTGYVKGVGTLSNVTVTGTLAPGFSPATVYYGSVAYTGTLSIDIESSTSYDVIHHSGPVTLGGTLNLNLAPGMNPASLTRFQFLTAPSITGSFGSITGLTPDPDHVYVPIVSATSVEFLLTLPGDATLDGRLTPDDFARIDRGRAMNLSGWSNGDFNFDGSVSPADYLLIDRAFLVQSPTFTPGLLSQRESQFGAEYVAQLLVSIPEPGTALSFTLHCLSAFLITRRRVLTRPTSS